MESIIFSLIATAIATAIGWIGKKWLDKWRLKYMNTLLNNSKSVKIIFPEFYSRTFPNSSIAKGANIPKNIDLMPLAEGRAIAQIAQAINFVSPQCEIIMQSPGEFTDDGIPFISIGGPSVNSVSGDIIYKYWTKFKLHYPEHVAQYEDVLYKPTIKEEQLQRDFGFTFKTVTDSGTNSIVFCGVWAFGTEIAVKSYLDLSIYKENVDLKNKLNSKINLLIVSTSKINSYRIEVPQIIGWWR
jgi:hypothetical protein